eukprot:TRINITY_DN20793_c0_g1_i1.p1 TRINITY_DN20793_c0_g1~~TRINITY_DN20793_c0_g1_i1.p1  ORF type:complete len:137 (-),score=31.28 TRINITY_DN20793_c0_g1_i1:205-615(-)
MRLFLLVIWTLVLASLGQKKNTRLTSKKVGGDCKYQGRRVCSGSIVKTFKYSKLVRVCDRGVLRYKQSKDVKDAPRRGPGVEGSQDDCVWYGQVFCGGDVVIDLYSWWFQMRCSDGKMRVEARQWGDVVRDSRYQP